jgi:succinate dehydrogenase / fumarate reductase flavoprotein subunit
MYPRHEMLDLVTIDGVARGIIARNLVTGEIERHSAHAVVLASGGYGNVYFLSTNAMNSNVTAAWKAHKHGAYFANPSFTQIHPTCIPVSGDYQSKLTLMSESLRNDGRVWVPKSPDDNRDPNSIPDEDRDYYLERWYPAFGNLVPRDVASRAAKAVCDEGRGVGPTGYAVYLDFRDAIQRIGKDGVAQRYGNIFDMYQKIAGDNPYETPMRIYPAVHYTMGGLWVDYNLQTTIPGLFSIGESNFSDHGANRLGASALMQGLADGYFILPYTIGQFLADEIRTPRIDTNREEFQKAEEGVKERLNTLLNINGTHTVDHYHRELGKIIWDYCGMSRNREGLEKASGMVKDLKDQFWQDVKVPGRQDMYNKELEKAERLADFFELGGLMIQDALDREESCGGHFREEYQTEEGEALRRDDEFAYVSAWEYKGDDVAEVLHKEELEFEEVELKQRSYA